MGEGELEVLPEETTKNVRRRKKKLYNSILQQMEFYFSDSNLTKDRFMSKLFAESPYIDIDIFLKFNKIRKLNCSIDDIRKALQKSEIIEVIEDNKVCRKKPVKAKVNVDVCTIYVENIKTDATHDWVTELFSEFGKVTYVSIPKYKHNKLNKGFAFVEFETEEEANQAISFFESIDCKMPSDKDPEQLRSIITFEGDKDADGKQKIGLEGYNLEETNHKMDESNKLDDQEETKEENKRKHSSSDEEESTTKKSKLNDSEKGLGEGATEGKKKKKKSKRDKKKAVIKELGIRVLSKKEWKKLRNKYLDLQRKKMKEFKNYLNKQRFSQKTTDKVNAADENTITQKEEQPSEKSKLEFISGVVIKIKTEDSCCDVKKLKAELKLTAPDVKYVDIPYPGSQELFLRFATVEAANDFCAKSLKLENTTVNEKTLISGEEEELYWKRMEASRTAKFEKQNKKQRGRDKLLKKANKEQHKVAGSHKRFDESTE